MTEKTQIVELLGEKALVLPALLNNALVANERAKYVLSLLQMAVGQAEHPQSTAPTLRVEREACGITDASLDHTVGESESDGHGAYHIPGAQRLVALLNHSLDDMIAPLALVAHGPSDSSALPDGYRERHARLVSARPAITDDMMTGDTITSMTSGRPASGDGVHVLVMDLHREINRLQGMISTDVVDGAKAYGITEADRSLIAAFMAGLRSTASLKFDHPGLDTTAARSGDTLLIQNDIGTTDAHVLVVRVNGSTASVTYTDIHAQRVRFFQNLFAWSGIRWDEMRSRQVVGIGEADLFYLAQGRFDAQDPPSLRAFLERFGSRIVFLIDWNKARKRLGLLVPNEVAVDVLKWASDNNFGHRGFLKLGGERLIYDALEQAVKTPLRYGEPLHEMIGADVARDYLRYVLQTTATGLLKGQSEALIRDEVRAELFNHFRSAEHRLLAESGRHARIVLRLARGLRGALRQASGERSDKLASNAADAKQAESDADAIVKATRSTVRRISGTEIFCRVLETADDAADDLEDAAFLAGLVGAQPNAPAFPAPVLVLADLMVDAAQAFCRAIDSAQHVRRGGAREAIRDFLEAVDRVVTVEHQTDERERAVTVALVGSNLDCRHLYLLGGIASHLEGAADALLRASLILRDHVLGEVTFA
jgi:uncharacterized protein Yka (UPF0111/DUF47 family)